MIDFNISVFLAFLLVFIFIILVKGLYRNKQRLFFQTIMFLYMTTLIGVTLFPICIDGSVVQNFKYNLEPFKYGFSNMDFLNVIMTIPMGFITPLIYKLNLKKKLVIILSTGFFIESFQYAIGAVTGSFLRVVDINDYICNTLGVLIGFIALGVFRIIFILVNRKRKLEPLGYYVYRQIK